MLKGAELFNRSLEIAIDAHAGQTYDRGAKYTTHVGHVGLMVHMAKYPMEAVAASVLHDVVEDNDEWSLARLTDEGMPASVVSAVGAVTYRNNGLTNKEEIRRAKIKQAKTNTIGHVVKFYDSLSNLATTSSFLHFSEPENFARRTKRYSANISELLPNLPTPLQVQEYLWELGTPPIIESPLQRQSVRNALASLSAELAQRYAESLNTALAPQDDRNVI